MARAQLAAHRGSGWWRGRHESNWAERKANGAAKGSLNGYTAPTKTQSTANQEWKLASLQAQTSALRPPAPVAARDTVPCVVLDPFTGSGTTGAVARTLGRDFIGCELNPEYVKLAEKRIGHAQPALFGI
jgi:hypothetical protein